MHEEFNGMISSLYSAAHCTKFNQDNNEMRISKEDTTLTHTQNEDI